ncbi:MAG: SpoIIE family protein phosphatase [Calditrichaceae bacterium]|nr:SpoIIE family protein phosphatase [Calditrichaceae bacterium]
MRIKLRTKMIAFTIILVMVIMTAITYFFTIREINLKRSSLFDQVERIAQNVATLQLVDQQEWSTYQDYINQVMEANKDIIYIAIYDERNSLRAHALNMDLLELEYAVISNRLRANIVEQLDRGLVADDNRDDIRTARVNIMINDRIIGSVNVGYSLISINDELREGIVFNLILAGIFTVIFSIAAFVVSRRLAYPIEQLNDAMLRVTRGDLSKKIVPQTHDEIAELVLAYNTMIENMRERKLIDSLGKKLSSTFQINELASLIDRQLKDAIQAASIKLFITEQNNSATFRLVTDADEQTSSSFNLSQKSVVDFFNAHQDGFILADVPDPVKKIFKSQNANDLMIPLIKKDKTIGILLFSLSNENEKFTIDQQHFAKSLSSPLSLALENTLLYDELKDQERMKRELEIARDIQQKLLPKSMPQIAGYAIEGFCSPTYEVGGDYFDFFELNDGKLGLVIADVSGKGASASFYMAQLKGMMMQSAGKFNSPKNLLIEINQKIYSSLDRNLFITMIYGILDTQNRELIISRAGHNALIHIKHDNMHTTFTPPGIGLGLDSGAVFKSELTEIRIKLENHDTLLFYTDGIIEAMNTKGEEFGEERLLQALLKSKASPISDKLKTIQEQLTCFLNGSKPQDDITMILIDCTF